MADQFLAEIRIFAGNFAPQGWASCDGQLLPISQNTALFSLLGTQYGGDGKSNFALPNLQGSVPIHQGQGAGLSPRFMGETGGSQTVTLLTTEMPSHNHGLFAESALATLPAPAVNEVSAAVADSAQMYAAGVSPNANMAPTALAQQGGSQPHNNLQPFLVLFFIIAMQGIFPARS